MGLLKNLRVLFGSDAGHRLLNLEERVSDVEFNQDRERDKSERRFRSLRKRQKDEQEVLDLEPQPAADGRLQRLRQRRAARSRVGNGDE
jgi:hypothetical protein